MQKFLKSNLFYSLISLLFALLLFFNANSGTSRQVTQSAQTYNTTAYDVPIQVDYDEDKYYVSGLPDTVSVHLSSLNRIKLNQEADDSTRSFKVVADLSHQSSGTVDVTLRVTNLTSGVEAIVDPAVVSVTIEKKVSQKFKVTPVLSDSIVKDGYTLGDVTFDKTEVTVTTGEQTMTQIKEVQAVFNPNRTTMESFSEEVQLQAIDSNGDILPVTIEPARVMGEVEVVAPTKTVSLKAKETGTVASGVASVNINLETDEAIITGPQSLLAELTTIEIPVDVTGIRKETTMTVDIPLTEDSLTATPKSVKVTLTPIFASQSGSSSAPTTSGSSSSSSSGVQSETSATTSSSAAGTATVETTTSTTAN